MVKECIFFLELFSVKIRLEIMFYYVIDRNETFFGHKKYNLSKSPKSHFSKGVNPCLRSKNVFFSLVVFGQNKTRNNVLDRKETFFGHKKSIFQSPKKHIFPKRLTHAFGQKMYFFLYLFLVKIRPEISKR